MLDYDGTLAPFRDDPAKAYPYPGIENRLRALARHPRVRLVLVSGRPALALAKLLRSIPGTTPDWLLPVEIWGNHGRERLQRDNSYHLEPLIPRDREALDAIQREIVSNGLAHTIESKPASLAVHWRTLAPAAAERVRSLVESLYARWAPGSSLDVLRFDGGLEIRPGACNKGSAVRQILSEEDDRVPAAYLGDDLTDEDAFVALGDRGLSFLVRCEWRESAAQFWLRPPDELTQFLDEWLQACEGEER
jgi:trehalose-phosphatase